MYVLWKQILSLLCVAYLIISLQNQMKGVIKDRDKAVEKSQFLEEELENHRLQQRFVSFMFSCKVAMKICETVGKV